MRSTWILAMVAAAGIGLAAPSSADAQAFPGSAKAKAKQQADGPAFCRSGAGHPVHGRQWCRDKGWAAGYDRWERQRWDDVVLRQPRGDGQQMGGSVLSDVLGDVVFGRLAAHGRQYGSGSVTGRWLDEASASVLQLSVGSTPFARLVDANRDGRVDSVLLLRR
ncbi:MAG TPA: hypothetical protein VK936_06880 [Longimicrobiales bacterium]|nr:hypothetical protein [Longimicrobiales bacterium]